MKVGFLIYSLEGGGAERMVSKLANYMAGKVEAVTVFLINPEQRAYALDPRVQQVVFDFKESGNRIKKALKRLLVIRQEVKKADIDVLYAFTTTMYPYAALCCKGLRTKVIGAERANPHVYGSEMRMAIRLVSPLCDGFVFQTEGARGCYPKSIAKRAVVISNAAPKTDYVRKDREDAVLKFCTAGRLHTDKDYDTLIEAFALFLGEYPSSQLTIFGDGELKEYYVKKCKELQIEDKVIFAGFVTNIYERMTEHDAFVFSSKSEGMPNAILEALAVGLPCLSTDCDYGPNELIKHGVNGLLCKVGDPEDMAEKMRRLAANPEERIKMGENALKVREDYEENKILGKYVTYAESLL